jgi:CRP/FNR family transcriptional regulator
VNKPLNLGNVSCGDCPIRHRAVCSRCETDELAQLEDMKYYRTFPAGQTIVWAGEKADFVGSVVSGVAALTQTMEDGRRQMVGLLQPSDFVGRPGRAVASFDVTAVTEVMLCCFQRRPFEKMMAETPHVATRLLEMTLDELDSAREWMLLLGRKTARERIASLLVILARRAVMLSPNRSRRDLALTLPLTREAMADYLGLTLETVSRQISALKRDGIIRFEGLRDLIVPDLDRLIEESGDDSDGGTLT